MKKHIEKVKTVNNYGGGGAVYGLGLVGALVYYLSHANSFIDALWGVLQSIFWPAFVVYALLSFLKM